MQGIRDVPLVSSLYLNRADDGFIFFDCGSYSHGPVSLNKNDKNVMMTTSLMLSSKARVLLSSTVDMDKKESRIDLSFVLHRVRFGDDGLSLGPDDFACDTLERAPLDIQWRERLQCRMSSPGQPWMMQRVQWEKEVSEEIATTDLLFYV